MNSSEVISVDVIKVHDLLTLFFLTFLFYTGVYLINNVMLASGIQQSDSVIHIHVSILFQIIFPIRLLQNIEQSSLCYTVGPCWLSILKIAVCGVNVNIMT